jgi:hypothetical protein
MRDDDPIYLQHLAFLRAHEDHPNPVTTDARRIVQDGTPYRRERTLGIALGQERVIVLGDDRDHVIVENGDLHILDSSHLNTAVRWTVHNDHDRKEK